MQAEFFAIAVIVLMTVPLIDCGEPSKAGRDLAAMEIERSADLDWALLSSGGSRPERLAVEDGLAYFMRDVEQSDIRLRELGLEFWNKYPDDPRRYDWLILTVHMPPHYAKDIHVWAVNETEMTANAAPMDSKALAAWDAIYPELRDAFWSAPSVKDHDRRFLWFGELEQRLLRAREAYARGEKTDPAPLLSDVVAFTKAYRAPFGENDKAEFNWQVRTLIQLTSYHNRENFGFTPDTLLVFLDEIGEAGNEAAADIIGGIRKWAVSPDGAFPPRFPADASASDRAWGSLYGYPGELPGYPEDQSSTFIGKVIFQHDQLVYTRKLRDLGLKLWKKYPDRMRQKSWLNSTFYYAPTYAMRFVDALHQRAEYWNAPVVVDQEADSAWQAIYPTLVTELMAAPEATESERRSIWGVELAARLWETERIWRGTGDKGAVNAYLRELGEYYRDFSGKPFWTAAVRILQAYKDYGLSDRELLDFFAPMRASENEYLRGLADAAYNHVELKRKPFEFTAPTMEGEEFDIAALRGKIVLVDHWGTVCSSCIVAMPGIHEVYQKYKAKGFEVVSVCYDGNEQRKKLARIEKEMGLTWVSLVGDGLWEGVMTKYGYQGFPQYMLLNRDGTLYAGTGEVNLGRNLEALLSEMLSTEARARDVP